MAQYDLLLTQNVHATLVEYTENFVAGARSNLITFNSSNIPLSLAPGSAGQVLYSAGAAGDLYWGDLSAGHTQNTDTGTTSLTFELDNDGFQIELTAESASKFGVNVNGGATYADIEAKDATFAKVTVVTAPSAGSDLTNKTYVDSILGDNNALVYQGVIDCAADPNYPAADAGDVYFVSVAGHIGGASGPAVEVGDMLICNTDSSGTGDHATVGSNWNIVQTNMDGVVVGPASSTDNYFAIWDGTTGQLLKNGAGAPGSMAYATATDYLALSTFSAIGQILYSTGSAAVAALAAGTSGDYLASGGAGAPTWETPGTMISEDASDYLALATFTGVGQILYSTGSAAVAVLAAGTSGDYLASGGAGAPTWDTPGTMIGEDASDYVANALFDANTVLYATSDNTPVALTVAEQTIVGRITSGAIDALTGTEVMGILWQTAPTAYNSDGTAGQIAYDDDYMYVCTVTGSAGSGRWNRMPLALNWV